MTNEEKKNALEMYAIKMYNHFFMDGWKFNYFDSPDNICNVARCFPNAKEIKISNIPVDCFTLQSLKDIFLHELTHAIVGFDHGHNGIFQKVCQLIGCKGNKTHNTYYIDYKTKLYFPRVPKNIKTIKT